jgi:hypothetical protein
MPVSKAAIRFWTRAAGFGFMFIIAGITYWLWQHAP